ncbi:xylitol dehydrogenase [Metarhizium acridum CQMa 102]|uniref:D-xylulose reductase n=1 Tax=Metarhizium acridum (strain CQMa 102) TaxID=655827 RepID=E9E2A6_METAQ|nr:xylitol dehydrogenase [Metarhizium acridum CQMa 102]EFY90022.1 xylitol dehydrogenase [Metarhizium acridum CQMa 102]
MAAQTLNRDEISNLSFILNKPYQVTYAERPKPTLTSPHDVIVAVNYTGICGSDVHYWSHGAIGHFVVKEPMVLGHESAGTVVEAGSQVTHLGPGDRVAIEPGYACRRCADCRAGKRASGRASPSSSWGADAVIDASGAEASIRTGLHAVRAGGTYVQGGMGRPDVDFPIMAMCLKEVTARGSFRYGPGDYELAVDLVASGKVDVKKLVTEVVPFDRAEEAFKKVKEGEVIKILIAGPNEKIETI